jgi:alkyldihydroxyacetonephosphate synthase
MPKSVIICGSESGLGIITKAKMQVHPVPVYKNYVGFLFKNFQSGFDAIRELYQEGIYPSMIRLQDEDETEMAFNLREQEPNGGSWLEEFKKMYLKSKGFTRPCLMIVGFEGSNNRPASQYEAAKKVLLKGGRSICAGPSVGVAWSKHKYDVPYLRDLMIDMGVICDVNETSTNWGNLMPLYKKVKAKAQEIFKEKFDGGFVGCHLSHSYSTGACLYFTWAAPFKRDELEDYYYLKHAITECIVEAGGTLSHHHAVGYEHKPWMQKELGTVGTSLLHDLKKAWDPNDIFNTGKHLSYPSAPSKNRSPDLTT